MNRVIKFKGKRVDNGEWVHGYYCKFGHIGKEKHYIIPDYASALYAIEVIHETVAQFSGLTDKNGKDIYDGDIVSYNGSKEVVIFMDDINTPCFCLGGGGGSSTKWHPYAISKRHIVIGNIHDNPELLKVGDAE